METMLMKLMPLERETQEIVWVVRNERIMAP